MRSPTVFCVAGLVTAGLLAVPAPAAAAGGSLAAPNGVLYPGCRYYPYSYSVSIPPGADSWSMDVELLAPDGTHASSDYVYDAATSGTGSVFVCGSEMPGRYTLTGTVEWDDYDSWASGSFVLAPTTLVLRQPRSRTKLRAKPRRPRRNQVVKFIVRTTDERPRGFFPTSYPRVVLEQKAGSRWKRVKGTRTSGSARGKSVVKVRWGGHPVRVRAKTLRSAYRASRSKSVRFR